MIDRPKNDAERDALLAKWGTVAAQVSVEGWSLFETLEGWEIERDDESEAFTGDLQAIAHVRRSAHEGSYAHQLAYAINGYTHPEEWEIDDDAVLQGGEPRLPDDNVLDEEDS